MHIQSTASFQTQIMKLQSDFDICLPQRLVVAASGGKDSTFLCFVLRDMGHEIIPAIVDLNYARFDAENIFEFLTHSGFAPVILRANTFDPTTTSSAELKDLVVRINDQRLNVPCGPCSQAKRILLNDFATSHGLTTIALGHHLDDFLTTMLKDYFVELYNEERGAYQLDLFREFVTRKTIDYTLLTAMIRDGRSST